MIIYMLQKAIQQLLAFNKEIKIEEFNYKKIEIKNFLIFNKRYVKSLYNKGFDTMSYYNSCENRVLYLCICCDDKI